MSQPPLRLSTTQHETKADSFKRLRRLSRLLDGMITIPGTTLGIGLDPILGLLPVAGDFIGVMLSAYIVLEAARMGVSQAILGRMVLNIIVDGLVGAVPVLGDFFDFAWTANIHNVKLLEDHLQQPATQRKSASKWFIVGILIGLFFIAVGLVAITVALMKWLVGGLFGG
jgi:Domain of unknown function (DUF4112)